MSEFMNTFMKGEDSTMTGEETADRAEATEAAAERPQPELPPEIIDATGDTAFQNTIVDVLCSVFDPEIPISLYELGLIYRIEIDAERNVNVMMTLTTPMCPVAESMPGEVQYRLQEIDGIGAVTVELTWDPPWTPGRMSEEARLELGLL